jgi:hypothetical protein
MGKPKEKVETIKTKYELELDRVSSEPVRYLGFRHDGIQLKISDHGVTVMAFEAEIPTGKITVPEKTIPFDKIPCYIDVLITPEGPEIVANKTTGRFIVGHLSGILTEPDRIRIKGWIR